MKTLFYLLSIPLLTLCVTFVGCQKEGPTTHQEQTVESYWTCSMHPQIHEKGPGRCNICGMDLTEVKKEKKKIINSKDFPEQHAAFTLSKEKKDLIGVETQIVHLKETFKLIETAGKVAYDPELYTAENEFIEALRQEKTVEHSELLEIKRGAKAMVASSIMRLKILGLGNQQIEQLRKNFEANTNYLIPQKGEKFYIYAELFERDLPYISKSMKAIIKGTALEESELLGEVVSVDPIINPVTRTAKVRLSVSSKTLELRPETYLDVTIKVPLGKRLTVPFQAVFNTGKESYLFKVDEFNNIIPQKITISGYADDDILISSGVKENEKIVVNGNFLIDSESRLIYNREQLGGQNDSTHH